MSARTERASLLLNQSRFELAEQELRLALADDPNDPLAHSLLVHALVGRKELAAATEAAGRAVAAGPDLSFTHYALATARYHRNHYPEAEAAIREAIRLNPSSPDSFALLAAIHAEREEWSAALAAAEEGLTHDPEHGECANLRAMALIRLGRRAEAGAATEGALARDPDDAFTHANRGWGLLHEGDPKRALEHFREALRLQPDLEFARAGLVEALKARYWLYRQVLRYFLWLSRMSPQARWGIVIGLLIFQQVIASVAKSNPALAPFLQPLLIAYVAFALTTWTAAPLTNLALRLNRFGRLVLTREEKVASNWVAAFVVAALACLGYAISAPFPYDIPGWLGALGFMILLLPISATFACQPGWPRRVMAIYTAGMLVMVVMGLELMWTGLERLDAAPAKALAVQEAALSRVSMGAGLLRWNAWAGLLSGFVANWLMSIRPRL